MDGTIEGGIKSTRGGAIEGVNTADSMGKNEAKNEVKNEGKIDGKKEGSKDEEGSSNNGEIPKVEKIARVERNSEDDSRVPLAVEVMGSPELPIEMDEEDKTISFNMQRIVKIENIEPYKDVLKGISIVSCLVKDIEALSQCPNLESVDLYQNQVTDVTPLAGLHKLKLLDLSFNAIREVGENLSELTNLESLALTSNKITEVTGLQNLTKLKHLELGANKIRHLDPQQIKNMSSLEQLWLGRNKLTDMNLPPLKSLQILSFQANRLTEWSDTIFESCPNLEQLYLSENGLDAPPKIFPGDKSKLDSLDLSKNAVKTLDNLDQFSELTDLWLNENQIQSLDEVKKLKGLKKLTTLYLEHNPFQQELGPGYRNAILTILPNLRQLDALMVPVPLKA